MMGDIRRPVYGQYVKHDSIPGGKAWAGISAKRAGKRETMTLSCSEWTKHFRNRKACLRWLVDWIPDALLYVFNEGVTVCYGTVRSEAESAGINIEPTLISMV